MKTLAIVSLFKYNYLRKVFVYQIKKGAVYEKRNMIYLLAVAGILCAMTNVDATFFRITKVESLSGTGNKVVTKSSDTKSWNANFASDGKTNTMILYMYDNPSTTLLGDTIIAVEGGGTVTQPARGKKGQSVKVVWRDYDGNFASYTCNGTVNVY
ncbi:hypothetical protein [[Eubacterium] hominis]|uniref:hypothetical protein n=1 Tax=[Eubacterium] hominis TaxID=2764325 RepID=UPI0022E351B0